MEIDDLSISMLWHWRSVYRQYVHHGYKLLEFFFDADNLKQDQISLVLTNYSIHFFVKMPVSRPTIIPCNLIKVRHVMCLLILLSTYLNE